MSIWEPVLVINERECIGVQPFTPKIIGGEPVNFDVSDGFLEERRRGGPTYLTVDPSVGGKCKDHTDYWPRLLLSQTPQCGMGPSHRRGGGAQSTMAPRVTNLLHFPFRTVNSSESCSRSGSHSASCSSFPSSSPLGSSRKLTSHAVGRRGRCGSGRSLDHLLSSIRV
ncbi:hypothetical protein BC826DRAFT_994240 [Russula brevipes]|nr:hypothetical protein BC826DRAFT_994240 [Russula brevipes]